MFVALQIATALAVLSEPFLPFTSKKLSKMLGFKAQTKLDWEAVSNTKILLAPGHQIQTAELLFSKVEDETIQAQLDKLIATKKANETLNKKIIPQKETITFEDFSKLDIRIGTIVAAEKMPKAKKLLVLKVETGLDSRTIVSGIAESFAPEDLIGKKVSVLINLAPRELRGVMSEGMILMTENGDGKLVFLNPDEAGVIDGESVS